MSPLAPATDHHSGCGHQWHFCTPRHEVVLGRGIGERSGNVVTCHTRIPSWLGWAHCFLPQQKSARETLAKVLQCIMLGMRHLSSLPSSSLSGSPPTASKLCWLHQLFDHVLWLCVRIVPVPLLLQAMPVTSTPAQ